MYTSVTHGHLLSININKCISYKFYITHFYPKHIFGITVIIMLIEHTTNNIYSILLQYMFKVILNAFETGTQLNAYCSKQCQEKSTHL